MSKKLLVGYGRKEITPPISVPLAGYGNTMTRMSQGCLDGLFATVVAITDEKGETLMLCTTDCINSKADTLVKPAREAITAATGVPGDHILIAGTHTHSGPDIFSPYDDNMKTWRKCYTEGLTAAAAEAMADRAEADILTGRAYTHRLNFVRHYMLENGSYVGDNFGDFRAAPIAEQVSMPDNQIQMVRFVREGAKDILMVNYQAHAKLASTAATEKGRATRAYLSADYIAPCRDYVEANADVLFAFYLGACGNINPISRIKQEMRTTDYIEYGQLLGETIVKRLGDLKEAQGGEVSTRQTMFQGQIDHTEDHMVEDAKKVRAIWEETNDYHKSAAAGLPYGIISPYHAGAIINRANTEETVREMEIDAACIGPVGFATAPYEMFDTNAKFVKDHSPFPMTFVISCANGSNNYIASDFTFEYGSYEVHNRTFVRGTAEALADTMVDMLKDIKNSEA